MICKLNKKLQDKNIIEYVLEWCIVKNKCHWILDLLFINYLNKHINVVHHWINNKEGNCIKKLNRQPMVAVFMEILAIGILFKIKKKIIISIIIMIIHIRIINNNKINTNRKRTIKNQVYKSTNKKWCNKWKYMIKRIKKRRIIKNHNI